MMMRRLPMMVLLIVLAMVFAGCGGGDAADSAPTTDPELTEDTTPVIEEPVEDPVDDGMDVSPPMLNDVFFAFDQHSLSSESRSILEGNSSELKRVTDATIIIEGHCDERGTKSYNLALGEKRARAAKDYLVSLGVAGSRVTIVSYGKERPFDLGHTEAGWAKNRRGHVVLK
jgi:peptidoglycan-associated lipoprotein